MDSKSILGYAKGSPYRNSPYLDINTPEGLITMENTPVDLLGIDDLGNVQIMKAGTTNPYKFPGTKVREIPIRNPYMQQGGVNQEMFDYLFGEDDDEDEDIPAQAPVENLDNNELSLAKNERLMREREESDLAMEQAMTNIYDNPYRREAMEYGDDGLDFDEPDTMYDPTTYTGQLSAGKWGSQNVGKYGQRIVSELTQSLGYQPTFNSIYRDPAQQQALIKSGKPAVANSWHLTGNAVDMRPEDWNRLPDEKKQYFRANYDVIYHDNHYHIEPKG